MKNLSRTLIALACTAGMPGCVTEPTTPPSAFVTSPRAKTVPAGRVKNAVAIGRSTRADVIAALGETLVIGFDNGFEVWVYRLPEGGGGEFVILFDPSGVVAKTRTRPPDRAR